jgi:carboxyl-terminal processing protease
MNQVLREMRGVKAMVLDLRVSSGGYDAVAMEIASRFAKDKQVVFRKHATGGAGYEVTITPSTEERFEGPVAVLIGENTVSAGELSDAIPKRLPNGWSFTVSIESILTKDGTLVEAKGVQPGVLSPKGDWASDIALALTKIRNR